MTTTGYDRESVAAHEAGHAAALVILGRLPWRVTADAHPSDRVWGQLEQCWDEEGELTRESVERTAKVIHCGPINQGKSEWPPKYPPPLGEPGDPGQLSACMRFLGWDRLEYDMAYIEAVALTNTEEFKNLARRIARALVLKDSLDRDDLRKLIGVEALERYGIPIPEEQENDKWNT